MFKFLCGRIGLSFRVEMKYHHYEVKTKNLGHIFASILYGQNQI